MGTSSIIITGLQKNSFVLTTRLLLCWLINVDLVIASLAKFPMVTFQDRNLLLLPYKLRHTWSDNKVRELATVCLPWQHRAKALIWFDDIDISAFHSCVVVDLWQSLSEWHLLMSACVLVRHHENVGASSERTLNFFLNLERVDT
jgi:hypothetical protein